MTSVTSLDEIFEKIQDSTISQEINVCKIKDNAKGFLKVTLNQLDPFLMEIPATYLVIEEDPYESNLMIVKGFTFKRSLWESQSFRREEHEKLFELIGEMKLFRACPGLTNSDVSRNVMTEVFDGRNVYRHFECHMVVVPTLMQTICPPCQSLALSEKRTPKKSFCPKSKLAVFICDYPGCDTELRSQRLLNQHKRRNHQTQLWKCQIEGCEKTFKRKETLTNHQSSHQLIKRFSCEICKAEFTRKGSMVMHLKRSHEKSDDSKSWSCADCTKLFFSRQQLERHRRIHVGDKPFSCKHCQKSFTRSHHLTRHIKTLHPPPREECHDVQVEYDLIDEDGNQQRIFRIIPI